MSHTPGPWVDAGNLNDIRGAEFYICMVARYEDPAVTQANINLIAAAPELLKVLNSFPMLLVPAKTAWGKQVQDWQETALAAIAKATGGAE